MQIQMMPSGSETSQQRTDRDGKIESEKSSYNI